MQATNSHCFLQFVYYERSTPDFFKRNVNRDFMISLLALECALVLYLAYYIARYGLLQ